MPSGTVNGDNHLKFHCARDERECFAVNRVYALAQLELAYFEAGRLRMLPPVREHLAGARLPAAEDIARAMEHYRELAETLGPRAGRPGGAETVARLAPEVANLDAVIRRGLEGGDITRWIDAAVTLTDFVRFSGHVTPSPLEPALAETLAQRIALRLPGHQEQPA